MKCFTTSSINLIILIAVVTAIHYAGISVALEISIDTHPRNQTVKNKQRVSLICIFNQNVNCVWTKNGNRVIIGGRYRMVQKNYNSNLSTRNCSFEIKQYDEKKDNGVWRCCSLATSEIPNSVCADNATLKSKDQKKTLPKEQNCVKSQKFTKVNEVIGYEGHTVSLPCKFRKKVKCNWLRNGKVVNVTGRYQIKSLNAKSSTASPIKKNNSETRDCSLTINNVKSDFDNGTWACSSMANDNSDAIRCNTTTLTIEKKKPKRSDLTL